MYFPYFRGKQYELITIRESASLMAKAGFVPIIEPVKEDLKGLTRSLEAVTESDGEVIVIANPGYGDHSENGDAIGGLLKSKYAPPKKVSVGILLRQDLTTRDVVALCSAHQGRSVSLIHAGFTDAKALAEQIHVPGEHLRHVFLEEHCGKLYRKHFRGNGAQRVLLRDGFQKRRNSDHPPIELFSDLHVTFLDEGVDRFGDFLVVGDDYSESGGPAYAVAIHLTFIDSTKDDQMYVHHFVSDRRDTPTDPAGKFAEALGKLVREVEKRDTHVRRTNAVLEFMSLHNRRHFPGLGYVKKLSMMHHIETMAAYFDRGR